MARYSPILALLLLPALPLAGRADEKSRLKDVLALRPIYHRVEPRVKAHIFVAALALLVQRLLERRLRQAKVKLSADEALQALETIRVVKFSLEGQPPRQGVSTGSPRARQVLKALAIRQLRPPTPTGQETEVS